MFFFLSIVFFFFLDKAQGVFFSFLTPVTVTANTHDEREQSKVLSCEFAVEKAERTQAWACAWVHSRVQLPSCANVSIV